MRRVCGLDVHKDSIYMCILYENGSKIESVFGVLTPGTDKIGLFITVKLYEGQNFVPCIRLGNKRGTKMLKK